MARKRSLRAKVPHVPRLVKIDELRAKIAESVALAQSVPEEAWELDSASDKYEHWMLVHEAAAFGLRYASMVAAATRATGLFGDIVDALDDVRLGEDDHYAYGEPLYRALTMLLADGAVVGEHARALVAHEDAAVRAAVAEGLRPSDAAAIPLLELLADDASNEVRTPARRSLAKVRDVEWWRGKFDSDPIARLTPDEARELAPRLHRLAEWLDTATYSMGDGLDERVADLEALPEPLAVEIAARVLAASGPWEEALHTRVGFVLLISEGGPERLIGMIHAVTGQKKYDDHRRLKNVVKSAVDIDDEYRCELALRLIDATFAIENAPGEDGGEEVAVLGAELAAVLWLREADPSPLIDRLLAHQSGGTWDHRPYGFAELCRVLDRSTHVPTGELATRLVRALAEDFPAPWAAIRAQAESILGRCERDVLDPVVRNAIAQGSDKQVRWALNQWLVGAKVWDAERDPPRGEIVKRLLDEPRMAQLLCDDNELRKVAFPEMRRRLRAGTSKLSETGWVLDRVQTLWPEPSPPSRRHGRRASSDAYRETAAAAELEKWRDWLGDEAMQGPVTESEWDRFRDARDEIEHADAWAVYDTFIFPPTLSERDRALFDRAMGMVREGRRPDKPEHLGHVRLALWLSRWFLTYPAPGSLELFDEVAEYATPNARGAMEFDRDDLCKVLGLSADDEDDDVSATHADDENPDENEWMDENDD